MLALTFFDVAFDFYLNGFGDGGQDVFVFQVEGFVPFAETFYTLIDDGTDLSHGKSKALGNSRVRFYKY